jgi:hypothetical protein
MYAWNQFPFDIPTDQEVVWVRIKYYYGKPFLAIWIEATQDFTSLDNSIVYPAWTIARWRSQF